MCRVMQFRITNSYHCYHLVVSLAEHDKQKKNENTYKIWLWARNLVCRWIHVILADYRKNISSRDWKVPMPLCKVLIRQNLKACTQFCMERLGKRNSHRIRWGYHKPWGKEELNLPSLEWLGELGKMILSKLGQKYSGGLWTHTGESRGGGDGYHAGQGLEHI